MVERNWHVLYAYQRSCRYFEYVYRNGCQTKYVMICKSYYFCTMPILFTLFVRMAKVRLTIDGKLEIEKCKNGNGGLFNITTPNGHTFILPFCPFFVYPSRKSSFIGVFGIMLTSVPSPSLKHLKYNEHTDEKKIFESINQSKILPYICISAENNIINGIFDFITGKWCPITQHFEFQLAAVEIQMEYRFIDKIKAFDRECENAKYLKAMGTFCMNAMDRADIMDVFSEVVARTKKKDDEDKKLNG